MTTVEIIKSYPYVQFADDENITVWFEAYNAYAQQYLDWFNNTPLAIYTRHEISGSLLDWVASGIYGCYRTPIPFGKKISAGPLNTYTPNYIPLNEGKEISNQKSFSMTDDVFKRVITWNFYKGDGLQMSIPWLRKRISRFCDCNMDSVNISFSGRRSILVKIHGISEELLSNISSIIDLNFVNLPTGYTFSVEAA